MRSRAPATNHKHPRRPAGFGESDVGLKGIKNFFEKVHECNAMCRCLGLSTPVLGGGRADTGKSDGTED